MIEICAWREGCVCPQMHSFAITCGRAVAWAATPSVERRRRWNRSRHRFCGLVSVENVMVQTWQIFVYINFLYEHVFVRYKACTKCSCLRVADSSSEKMRHNRPQRSFRARPGCCSLLQQERSCGANMYAPAAINFACNFSVNKEPCNSRRKSLSMLHTVLGESAGCIDKS